MAKARSSVFFQISDRYPEFVLKNSDCNKDLYVMTDQNIEVTCDKFLTTQYGEPRKHLLSVIKLGGIV